MLGTPTYMAPEQASGHSREVGPHSDQYALGVILYELLTGRPPFQGSSIIDTLEAVRTQEPVSPAQLQPRLPKDVNTICLKALSKEPAKRYENAGAMADDLERFLRAEPIRARPVSRPERLWRWCRRKPWRVAGLASAVMVLGIAITAGSAAFAASLKAVNAELAASYKKEERAKEGAQANERAATLAKNDAIAARNAEADAREKERHAREKAEALVQAAFAQNRNALEAQRVLSVLLNQRLLAIPGTQAVREELIRTTMTGLEATIASLEKLGTVARDDEGFAVATRTLAGIYQRAGLIAMEYGKYDETARYFRRMEELLRATGRGRSRTRSSPLKVKASVKATLGDFQMDRIGDAGAALESTSTRQAARPPSSLAGPRAGRRPGEPRRREHPRRARGRPPEARRPSQGPRAVSRRNRAPRPVRLAPALADQDRGPPRSAGLREKLGGPQRLTRRLRRRPPEFRDRPEAPPEDRRRPAGRNASPSRRSSCRFRSSAAPTN